MNATLQHAMGRRVVRLVEMNNLPLKVLRR